jgi:hypothetical protein
LTFKEKIVMSQHKTPELPVELFKRIKIVRRDFGNLLFHFTRAPEERFVEVDFDDGGKMGMPGSAGAVLRKILYEGRLKGTSGWTYGHNCVCFTEAPIQEFNSIFSLVEIAASEMERPRYEPYGIAVSKTWLFARGGRPVIYDHPDTFSLFSKDQQYRFVPYNPVEGIDFTWEREWRIKIDYLKLNPNETLVVVPTSEEAFELVYEFADPEADWDDNVPIGVYHKAKWLAVSLDIFGLGK